MAHRMPSILFCPAFCLAATAPLAAQTPPVNRVGGGILVTPTRLVFTPQKRSGEVTLVNPGSAAGRFRISLVGMDMDPDGGCRERPLERVEGQVAVQEMVRFSPKVVALEPRESQVVRIQIRKPADLPPGEYRVHMVFREEPPPSVEAPPAAVGEAGGEAPKAIAIRLTSVFGVAIPLIIRHGETSARADLTELKAAPGRTSLTFRLGRTGNQSLHGNFRVTFQPTGGRPVPVAEANALSVFTPNPFRNVSLPLKNCPAGPGRFRVLFAAPADQGGAPLAEAALEVP